MSTSTCSRRLFMLAVTLFIVTLVPLTASLALQARGDVDNPPHLLHTHPQNLMSRDMTKSALLPRMPIEGPVVQPDSSTAIGTEPIPNTIQQPDIGSDSDPDIASVLFCPSTVNKGSLAIACVCAFFGILLNVWSVVVFAMGMREEKRLWHYAGNLQDQADDVRKDELKKGQLEVDRAVAKAELSTWSKVRAYVAEKRGI